MNMQVWSVTGGTLAILAMLVHMLFQVWSPSTPEVHSTWAKPEAKPEPEAGGHQL
jgi:hypothetical protein